MSEVTVGLSLGVVLGVAMLVALIGGAVWLERRHAERRTVFKAKLREIRDRAKREMREATTEAERDEICTRAKDEIEDVEL